MNISKSLVGAALAAKGVLNFTGSFAAKAAPTAHIKFQTGCNTTLGKRGFIRTVRPEKTSQVMIDKTMTLKRDKLGAVFGSLSDEVMLKVSRGIAVFLGIA